MSSIDAFDMRHLFLRYACRHAFEDLSFNARLPQNHDLVVEYQASTELFKDFYRAFFVVYASNLDAT